MSRRTVARTLFGAASLVVAVAMALWLLRPGPVQAPRRWAPSVTPAEPELSALTIPVRLDLADLAASVEAKVPRLLVDTVGQPLNETWSLDVRATRPGPVTVAGRDGELVIEIPLVVHTRAYRAGKADRRAMKGREAPDGIRMDFRVVVRFATHLSISEDWRMVSQSTVSHRWVEPPRLEIGPFKVPVTQIVDKALAGKLDQVAADIDARMAQQDQLRVGIERAWAELSAPRLLAEDPPTWFVSRLEGLYAGDIDVRRDELLILVGVAGQFGTVIGDPGPAAEPTPLPARMAPPTAAGIRLALPVALQWGALSTVATRELAGQEWTLPGSGGVALTVDGAELYPAGDKIVVALRYHAATPGFPSGRPTDGTLYLTGRPELDVGERVVRIADFDYAIETWDLAVARANALLQSGIEGAVREHLEFPFGTELDGARADANRSLGQRGSRGSTMRGDLQTAEITGVHLTEQSVVEAVVTGSMEIQLDGRGPARGDSPPTR